MSEGPDIKHEYLDGFAEEKIDAIRRAAQQSEQLRAEIERYNTAAERAEDPEFYRRRLEEVYERVSGSQKVAEVQQAMAEELDRGPVQTPVLKAKVVDEFDGERIWIEPESMMKGLYGVEMPGGVAPDAVPIGSEVAVDPQTFEIVDVLNKTKDSQFAPADTAITFSDIGGLDHIIDQLRKNIGVQLDPEKRRLAEEWDIDIDKSILLVGRPGTGKTMLAKALANEFDAEIFTVNAPQLVEKFIGEGAKKIKKLYDQASTADKPAIVFIDEIDAIAKSRDENRRHGGEEVERTMSQLLSELDGLDKEAGEQDVVSIFATNKPAVMDPAIINRCAALEVPVPDAAAKEEIFRIHTRRLPLADDVDFGALVALLDEEDTGRDVAQVCKQAALGALFRDEDDPTITMQDFEHAIGDIKEGKAGMAKDFLVSGEYPGEIFA